MAGFKRKQEADSGPSTKKRTFGPKVVNNKIKRTINNLIQRAAELKYIQTTGVEQTVTPAGTLVLVNGLTQADDVTNRNARKVNMRSVQIKGVAVLPTTATNALNGEVFKCSLVIDTQPNAAAPAVADIYDTATLGMSLAMRQIATYPDRFKVVKEFSAPWVFTSAATSIPIHVDMFVDLSKLQKEWSQVQYGGTGNTISTITKNSMWLVFGDQWSTNTGADTGNVGFTYNVRVKYTDI